MRTTPMARWALSAPIIAGVDDAAMWPKVSFFGVQGEALRETLRAKYFNCVNLCCKACSKRVLAAGWPGIARRGAGPR